MNRETIKPSRVTCSAGNVDIPILYEDGSVIGLFFRVGLDEAGRLVQPGTLEPIRFGGRAIALLIEFEYRRTGIGSYGELGVAIFAKGRGASAPAWRAFLMPQKSLDAGWLIINLPVTTEIAHAAGVDLWGFPKYIKPIHTEFTGDRARVVLEGELEIEHERGYGVRMPAAPVSTLTVLNGEVLRTFIPVKHRVKYGGARSVRVRVTGEGPTATTVKQLGLDRVRPFLAFRSDTVQMSLPLGSPIGGGAV